MSTTIPQRDLRNHNAQIIDRVVAGESFVVTRDGVAVAEVRPHEAAGGPERFPRTATLRAFVAESRVDQAGWLADVRAGDDEMSDDPFDDPA